MSDVRHFPTGLPNYREVGAAKIYGRNKALIALIAPAFNSDTSEISNDTIIDRLRLIEAILRNGLPDDDNVEASVIAYAHSEVELLLEAIVE